MLILAIAIGAAVAVVIFWPIKKSGSGNGPPGGGNGSGAGGNPTGGGSNSGNDYLPYVGDGKIGGRWIAGHEGVYAGRFAGTTTNVYIFGNGPGVKCNPNSYTDVANDKVAAAGNEACMLTDEPTISGQITPDYTINGVEYFYYADQNNPYGAGSNGVSGIIGQWGV